MKKKLRSIAGLVASKLPVRFQYALFRSHYRNLFVGISDSYHPEMEVLPYLISEGDTVLDIGACFGTYTKLLAKLVGSSGRVIAFEPNPRNYPFLLNNIRTFGLNNTKAFQYAISETAGTQTMTTPLYQGRVDYYRASLEEKSGDRFAWNRTTVRTLPVDAILSKPISAVTYIKVDVEGHELSVLDSARKMIKTHAPAWMIEINENPYRSHGKARDVLDRMKDSGYEEFLVEDGKLVRPDENSTAIDYFFLTGKQIKMCSSLIKD